MFSDNSIDFNPFVDPSIEPKELPTISQYAKDVLDYSSSYGSHGTISYSALNICGRPCKYPNYGDFAECFSLRHYGPVSDVEFSPNDVAGSPTFHDHIVIQFEQYVLPREIKIYETYNPGAVVRIYAYLWSEKRWELLWEEFPVAVEKRSREFCPKIKKVQVPTRIIRLEFNCSHVDYYIGIDAVMLTGLKAICPITIHPPESKIILGLIQKKLETVNLLPTKMPSNDAIENFLRNDLNKFLDKKESPRPYKTRQKNLRDMPDEVLFKIVSNLDLRSLYNCSAVCRKFNQIARDPLLYISINLKRYWFLINGQLVDSLQARAKHIKKLDMSCCDLPTDQFVEFIRAHGTSLTNLRLNSIPHMKAISMQAISFKCWNLTELQLQNNKCPTSDYSNLTLLKNLRLLNVGRTHIDTFDLVQLMKANPKLEHLNISFNQHLSIDQVCMMLSIHNKKMKTLDFWKCHNLTTSGLMAMNNCLNLEEVNFGWNLREESNITTHFKNFISASTKMRKMVLAAVRGIAERDLNNISGYCKNLEYLDLMGNVGITGEGIHKLLQECPTMKFMDLSFCENLDDETLIRWSDEYGVCIKRSKIPSEF